MSFNITHFFDETRLPRLAAVFGGLLAAWVSYQSHGHINNDGLLYIEAARLFAIGEWGQGFALWNWPLYPLLIAGVHYVTGAGLQMSAHILAIIFFSIVSVGLPILIKELGGDALVMRAGAVLLFCSTYMVGDVLPMVVRDHGFWAFHLWSIIFFIRFYKYSLWSDALGWGAAAVVATLFRIEGITYLFMLPFVLLSDQRVWKERLQRFARGQILLLVISVGVLAILFTSSGIENLGRLGDPLKFALGAYQQVFYGLNDKAHIFAKEILGKFLADYALTGILLTLFFVILKNVALSAGWIQLVLSGYFFKCANSYLRPKHATILAWLLAIGVVNATFVTLSVFVLTKRYVLPVGMLITAYAAFGLAALYSASKKGKRNIVFLLTILLLVLQFGLVVKLSKKDFEIEAVRWVLSNTPANSRIYYDSSKLQYYSGQTNGPFYRRNTSAEDLKQLVLTEKLRDYDYLLAHVGKDNLGQEIFLTAQLHSAPLAIFDSGHNSRVLIYRIKRKLSPPGNTGET